MKKDNWNTLKLCLRTEKVMLNREISEAVKDKNWINVVKLEETLSTIEWVLKQIDHIEHTGDCL